METLDAPVGLRASRFAHGEDEFLVLSYGLDDPELPPSLTCAERDVAAALLRGCSMAAIAAARCTSLRTVANQIRSVYRKLGVRCRLELAALLRQEVR